ncbi:SseB family protein [Actinomyces bowdenii]|uniref:SseB family protein n=1 Tax=Actinomyces bowdenii TaxID=131109 RepID=A0A3P1V7H8_9ACTO|nr:SseB family protein [Actinomyces bowdenii]
MAAALAARAKMERLLAAPSPFAGDDGAPDPAVTAALEDRQAPRHEYLDRLWAALSASRLIVPVAAHALEPLDPGESGSLIPGGPGGARLPTHAVHTAEPCQDAAALAVDLGDGHRALPVFTSARALTAWRPEARPVPVEPRRAAQAACRSTDQLWVLDPGTLDLRLPRPAVLALAGGQDWVPSWRSRPIQDELRAQLGAIEGVAGLAFAPGQGAELRILIRIQAPGRAEAAAVLEQCQHVMVNPAWGELIDTVELCPLPVPRQTEERG